MMNAAARVVTGTKKFERGLSRLLHTNLHWLNVPERVIYKLSVMMYSCLHGQAPQYLLDFCQPDSDVASRHRLRSAGQKAEYIWPAGFFCGWSAGVEFVARLPERPRSQQRHVLQAPKDVSVCGVLIHVQRIRGFTTMRYINQRFTYLLTYDMLSLSMCYKLFIHSNTQLKQNYKRIQ